MESRAISLIKAHHKEGEIYLKQSKLVEIEEA